MQVNLTSFGKTTVLQLEGAFVFDSHRALRAVCRPILDNPNTQFIQLELSHVEYLDSSALGMMLLMKEKALSAGKEIQIKGAQGMVLQVLEVAKFDRLFTLLH
jgi:anti-anti-sigma factor